MSIHQSPDVMNSHRRAIENLPADAETQRKVFADLFAARDHEREERRKIREASKVREREDMLQERLKVDPMTIRSMRMWSDAFARNPYRASVAFTQFQVFAAAQGWNEDVEQPEDETPVMDRTKTAKRMSGFSGARDGSRASYGMTQITARQREVETSAERCLEKLRRGIPPERLREGEGAGRPSAAWEEGRQLAIARYEAETEAQEQTEAAE